MSKKSIGEIMKSERVSYQEAKRRLENGMIAPSGSLPRYINNCRPPFRRFGSQIFGKYSQGDSLALDIRGWGRLTNASSKLTEEEAMNLQDEFGDWVCKVLNDAAENGGSDAAEGRNP